jgi:hypothetical protein
MSIETQFLLVLIALLLVLPVSLFLAVSHAGWVNTLPGAQRFDIGFQAAVFLLCGWWAAAVAGLLPVPLPADQWLLAGYALATVVSGKAVIAYLRRPAAEGPAAAFARRDRLLYAPLALVCLVGLAIVLAIMR